MPIYSLYSLRLDSEISLPELPESVGIPDIYIRLGHLEGFENWPMVQDHRRIRVDRDRIGIYWEPLIACVIDHGRHVTVHPLPGVDDELIRLCLLGPVIALAAQQLGATVLHASCVDVIGCGVAFLAEKGWGKSTLAAMMHRQGHQLICDDLTVLRETAGQLHIEQGSPSIKLCPEVIECLGEHFDDLPQLHSSFEKKLFRFERVDECAPVPLSAIFILDWGPESAIELLKSFTALRALAPHWYGARFGLEILHALGVQTHFLQCSHLVQTVPCARLIRPRRLDALADVANLVQDYVSHLAPVS